MLREVNDTSQCNQKNLGIVRSRGFLHGERISDKTDSSAGSRRLWRLPHGAVFDKIEDTHCNTQYFPSG